jgi:hypothetical protein
VGETARAYIPQGKRNDWRTPANALCAVRAALGQIDLDPCASSDPEAVPVGAVLNLREGDDGLSHPCWANYITAFVNPPYADNAAWIRRCAEEGARGLEVIALIPARVDTRYWHDHVKSAAAVCFWRGRLKFVGAENSAPFPVAFIYWGRHTARFAEAFSPHGLIYRGLA